MAGLTHTTNGQPGLTRRRAGKGFSYRDPDGAPIADPATLARIRALAIPPAWTKVWICPGPDGHLQAVGEATRVGSNTATTRDSERFATR